MKDKIIEAKMTSTDFIAGVQTDDRFVFLKAVGASGNARVTTDVNEAIGFVKLASLRVYADGIESSSNFRQTCKLFVRRIDTTIVEVR